jgi:hypothetical protein
MRLSRSLPIIKILFTTFVFLFIVGCSNALAVEPTLFIEPSKIPLPTSTPTPFQPILLNLFLSEAIPDNWRTAAAKIPDVNLVGELFPNSLVFSANIPESDNYTYGYLTRIFAVVVPFPTVSDEISSEELKSVWINTGLQPQSIEHIRVDSNTAKVLSEVWGEPDSTSVIIQDKNALLETVWQTKNDIAIVPFEDIEPKWKVLKIDGISPLDKPMEVENYPLSIKFYLSSTISDPSSFQKLADELIASIPKTNRDESKMTVVVMSGTTAIVRAIAYKIDIKGINHPIEKIKDWFLNADIRHVSNEISFYTGCPAPDPNTGSLKFCSDPTDIAVLEGLGVNVVELTGNHLNDYGPENFVKTLEMYKERGWGYFGGGFNEDVADLPLKMENNGNKIAFVGCNVVGPQTDWAIEDRAGSAKCDENYFNQITELKSQGYVVFATFQENEVYELMYKQTDRTNFHDAALAGADVVQGSQAHYAMGFEFLGNTLIHYGLGNLLFDQMNYLIVGPNIRREFIDRHVIYDGKYINTELLTAMLTDWSKPVPMTKEDRHEFLVDIFNASKMR